MFIINNFYKLRNINKLIDNYIMLEIFLNYRKNISKWLILFLMVCYKRVYVS